MGGSWYGSPTNSKRARAGRAAELGCVLLAESATSIRAVLGRYLVVALRNPGLAGLPADTRIAAYDAQTGSWSPLIGGRFVVNSTFVIAVAKRSQFSDSAANWRRPAAVSR